MSIFKKVVGNKGEALAYSCIKKKGFKILETNFKNKIGEIDIIALDKETIVFIEVKYRNTALYGLPSEAVTKQKQNKIRKVAISYLQKKNLLERMCRFDVVSILNDEITYIENAF